MALWRAQVTITNSALGGNGTNTWHMREAGTGPTIHDHLNNIMGWIEDFYTATAALYTDGAAYTFDGVCQGIGPNEGETSENDPWTVTGTGGAGCLPPFTALCVNWKGESGDRSKRGRTFLGPISPANNADNGKPVPTVLTDVRAAAAALVDQSDSFDDGAVGIWSRQESLFRDVVASNVNNQWASLRTRRD